MAGTRPKAASQISAQRSALHARPRLEQLARAVDAASQARERVGVRVGREEAARLRDASAAELAVVAQHRAQLAPAEVVPARGGEARVKGADVTRDHSARRPPPPRVIPPGGGRTARHAA